MWRIPNLFFRDSTVILFFVVVCTFIAVFGLYKLVEIEIKLNRINARIDQHLEDNWKTKEKVFNQLYDLRLKTLGFDEFESAMAADQEIANDNVAHLEIKIKELLNEIKQTKFDLIELYQKEKVELEKIKCSKSTNTFKSLAAAFSPTGKLPEDD